MEYKNPSVVSVNEEIVAHPGLAVHTASDVSTLHSCECIS